MEEKAPTEPLVENRMLTGASLGNVEAVKSELDQILKEVGKAVSTSSLMST